MSVCDSCCLIAQLSEFRHRRLSVSIDPGVSAGSHECRAHCPTSGTVVLVASEGEQLAPLADAGLIEATRTRECRSEESAPTEAAILVQYGRVRTGRLRASTLRDDL